MSLGRVPQQPVITGSGTASIAPMTTAGVSTGTTLGKTTATTIATADHVQVLPAQLVDSVAQLDDSGANTAERYDWQAAMAASDGLALYFDAMGDDGPVRLDSQDEVLCEWHEDYVLKRKDSVVLVSASTGIRELAPTPPGRAVPDACAPADRHGRDVHAGAVAARSKAAGGLATARKAERGGRGTARTYLLRGLVRCGICQRKMQGATIRAGAYYRCTARTMAPGSVLLDDHAKPSTYARSGSSRR